MTTEMPRTSAWTARWPSSPAGARGSGGPIAEAFAAAGASVVVAARRRRAIDDARSRPSEAGGAARRGRAPTSPTADAVRAWSDAAVEAFGTVDILVNNAGAAPFMSTIESIRARGIREVLPRSTSGAR